VVLTALLCGLCYPAGVPGNHRGVTLFFHGYIEAYLIECNSIGGLSGSLVFANRTDSPPTTMHVGGVSGVGLSMVPRIFSAFIRAPY
jgi:hypothetical protein